jgi:DNA-binding Xre family transcriptional regulator
MIDVRIQEVCKQRGINTAYKLQKAAELTPTLASSLFNQTFKQISLPTLTKLCLTLNCTPGRLLRLQPKK